MFLVAPKGRGIRQRLELDDEPQLSDAAQRPRGGIRSRLDVGTSVPQSAASSSSSRGRERRLEEEGEEQRPEATGPLNILLRKRWARGEVSAFNVLETVQAAAGQGAAGFGRLLKDHVYPKNAHRDMVAAMGWPDGAPE